MPSGRTKILPALCPDGVVRSAYVIVSLVYTREVLARKRDASHVIRLRCTVQKQGKKYAGEYVDNGKQAVYVGKI